MRRAWLTSLAIAAGCGGGRVRPSADDSRVVTWSTELPPYRLPTTTSRLLVDGGRAFVAGGGGYLSVVDLATGVVTSRRTELAGSISALARLGDGRIAAVESADDAVRIHALTPDLGLELVYEQRGEGWSSAELAVAPDGTMALTGDKQPIFAFGADWTPGAQLGAPDDPGYHDLDFVDGGRQLLAAHAGTLYTFDVATGGQTGVAAGARWVGHGGSGLALAAADDRAVVIDLGSGAVDAPLPPEHVIASAMSPDGEAVAVVADEALLLFAARSRTAVARYALPEASGTELAYDASGARLVLATGATIRVLDTASGSLSDPGPGPRGSPAFLAFAGGYLVAGADHLRRWPVGGGPSEILDTDGDAPAITDGAVSRSGELAVIARPVPEPPRAADAPAPPPRSELATWALAQPGAPRDRRTVLGQLASIDVGEDGAVTVGAWQLRRDDQPGRNFVDVSVGAGWDRLLEIHYDGYIDAIDASAGRAAVSRAGAVRIVALPGATVAARATIPRCDSTGNVTLERGGARLATDDDHTVWVWSLRDDAAARIARGMFTERVGEIAFVPGRPELVLDLDDRIGWWDYQARTARAIAVPGIIARVALDARARRVGVALTNGRIQVIALDDLRRGDDEPIAEGEAEEPCRADPMARPEAR